MFENFATTAAAGPVSNNDYITYVCISTPNLNKLKRNFAVLGPHIDKAVVVIGRRDEEAEKFLGAQKNTTIIYREWDDSFRDQYQAGLNAVRGGWMLWLDDDELPSEEMLRSLRPLIKESQNATRFDVVSFRCCDVWDGKVGEPSNYYRELFTAWNPTLHFEINLHQYMAGKMRGARCDMVYYHHKSNNDSYRGAVRNWFIGGAWADSKEGFEYWHKETGQDPRAIPGGPVVPNPNGIAYPLQDGFKPDVWHEMKDILARNHPEVKYFHHLDKLIREKTICQEFVDWAERHNAENDPRPQLNELHNLDRYLKEKLNNT